MVNAPDTPSEHRSPLARATAAYRAAFAGEPTLVAQAPGRVNLIGEHTDYNDGFVLPLAIDRGTVAVAAANNTGRIIVVAADQIAADGKCARDSFALDQPIAPTSADWANYVRGVALALQNEGAVWTGVTIAIAGNVPLGSGLSSSASLELAVGSALAALGGLQLTPARLAQLCQWAENHFVGCACGIMDQLIGACGAAGHALLIDCRSLACQPVAIPVDAGIIVAHSGIRHTHAGGEYNDRRAQCSVAAAHYGVAALRDLDVARLVADAPGLDPVAFRRARHVVTENARTVRAAQALTRGDFVELGQLMAQSHASMRDDFEITLPAIDTLAAIMAAPLNGVGGARMTGGGFGGCVIALAPTNRVDAVIDAVARHYRAPDGSAAELFVCCPSAGASVAAFG